MAVSINLKVLRDGVFKRLASDVLFKQLFRGSEIFGFILSFLSRAVISLVLQKMIEIELIDLLFPAMLHLLARRSWRLLVASTASPI